jgi:dienelactone hydrolase
MKILRWWILSVLLFLHASQYAFAQSSGETVWVPMKESGWLGERMIRLEATLYKPEGAGPFPVMIFNHGSSGGPIPSTYTEKARGLGAYATSRGMALLIPMRRGRGQSEGANKEEPSPCTVEAARQGLRYASEALAAVYDYLRQQDWIAIDKVVLAGHSRGGMLASVYAAQHPGSAIGVINFSGGWKDDNCGPTDVNTVLFSEAGAGPKVPNLFLYARGDGFYSDHSMQTYADVFKAAGGNVMFELFEVEKINGHQLFHRAMPLWQNSVDQFLENLLLTKLGQQHLTR